MKNHLLAACACRTSTALLLTGLLTSSLTIAAPLREARVTRIVNDVDLIAAENQRRDARANDVMRDDMILATGHKSRAELQFTDQTLARIGANSYFTFAEGTRNMELGKGTMLLKVPKGAGGAKISTQSVTAAITGTTVLLETNPGGDVVLKSGQPLPPTPEADADLRRQGMAQYIPRKPGQPGRGPGLPASETGVRVSSVSGSVRAMRPGDSTSSEIQSGETLPQGTFIFSQSTGSATFTAGSSIVTRITPNSSIRLLEAEVRPGLTPRVEYELKEGSILSALGSESSGEIDYKIRTPQGVVAARGTVFGTTARNNQTGVFGAHGNINFSNQNDRQRIKPGEFRSFRWTGSRVEIGSNLPPNSPEFQQMMVQTLQLVEQAADRGLVRAGLPNDVRGALIQAGIQPPPPPQPQPPSRTSSPADTSQTNSSPQPTQRRRANRDRGTTGGIAVQGGNNEGFSKMIVVEGTMRIYLNDRVGESRLMKPGDMIILNPDANRLPEPVQVDIGRLIGSSKLVSGFEEPTPESNDPGGARDNGASVIVNDPQVQESLTQQKKQIREGNLQPTGLATVGDRLVSEKSLTAQKIEQQTQVQNDERRSTNKNFLGRPSIAPGTTTISNTSAITPTPLPPSLETQGKTILGTVYDPATNQSIANAAFEDGQKPIDALLGGPDGGADQPLDDPAVLFKFENLRITGNPSIDELAPNSVLAGGDVGLGLLSINDILIGDGLQVSPNAGLGLPDDVFLVSEQGGITIDDAVLGGFGPLFSTPLNNDWVFYARGGELSINNFSAFTTGALDFLAQTNIDVIGFSTFEADELNFIALNQVDLTNAGIVANQVNLQGQDILFPTSQISSPSDSLTFKFRDTNGGLGAIPIDAVGFDLTSLRKFDAFIGGRNIEVGGPLSVFSSTQSADLFLGTDQFFDGTSSALLSADGFTSRVALRSGTGMDLNGNISSGNNLTSTQSDIFVENTGPGDIFISFGVDGIFANATPTGTASVDITNNGGGINLGFLAGAGPSIGAIDGMKTMVQVKGRFDSNILGTTSLTSGNSTDATNASLLVESELENILIDNGASLTSSTRATGSPSDFSKINLIAPNGAIQIGPASGIGGNLTTNGTGITNVTLDAASGIDILGLSTLTSGQGGVAEDSTLFLSNTNSGNIVAGDNTTLQALSNPIGRTWVSLFNNGDDILIGTPGGSGSTISASGGADNTVSISSNTGNVNLQGSTVVHAQAPSNGSSTVFIDTAPAPVPGNITIGDDVQVLATTVGTVDTSQNLTSVNVESGGTLTIGGGGSGALVQSEIGAADAGSNVNASSVFMRAQNGIAINDSSQIKAILNSNVGGWGLVDVFTDNGNITVGNDVDFQADDGTVSGAVYLKTDNGDIQLGGAGGVTEIMTGTFRADALGTPGTIRVGNVNIDASTLVQMAAANQIIFEENATIQGAAIKQAAAPTVTVNNGVNVNILGPALDVFTDNPNYTGSGGNGSTTGQFTGSGAATQPLANKPF